MNTVAVIGGGASGIMAALTAAQDKNNRVILLERQQRLGRKLLATGNGRCNLTNTGASAENYHGEHPEFVLPALSVFTPAHTLRFFRSLGLLTTEEYGGRVYPLSQSANSVVDVLRFAVERSGIELRTSTTVRELRRRQGGFTLLTDGGNMDADYVVMACGGAAGAKLGGVMDGYELLKPLGHKRTALYPALVQLITDPEYPRSLKGVRADAHLRLMAGDELLAESRGELQFTDTGVSGPSVFDISRTASVSGSGLRVKADFLQDYSESDILALLISRRAALPQLEASELFTGAVHNRLGRMLVKYAGISSAMPMNRLRDAELYAAAHASKSFELPIRGTEGFDSAQVTAGGIRTTGINADTMESWFVPHLFICGELLDVDGDCGGYNLQWAWASGNLAGRLGNI